MNKPSSFLALVLPLAAAVLAAAPAARAQSGTPQSPYVITAPTKITRPGYYILGGNINSNQTSGYLIEIATSNVTLDFNGFYIAGAMGNTTQTTTGVFALEQSNLTIKNGTIAYCAIGIAIGGNNQPTTNAVGETIDNMRLTYCYYEGIELSYCPASTITNCKISQTGGSSVDNAYGIFCYGAGETIQNNTVSTVTTSGSEGYGIYANGCFARQNTISNAAHGVTSGKYQDNLTLGCATPYSGGVDAGGNN